MTITPPTEIAYLKGMLENIRQRCEAIELEHAKLDAEKAIIQGYGSNFQRRLDAIKGAAS